MGFHISEWLAEEIAQGMVCAGNQGIFLRLSWSPLDPHGQYSQLLDFNRLRACRKWGNIKRAVQNLVSPGYLHEWGAVVDNDAISASDWEIIIMICMERERVVSFVDHFVRYIKLQSVCQAVCVFSQWYQELYIWSSWWYVHTIDPFSPTLWPRSEDPHPGFTSCMGQLRWVISRPSFESATDWSRLNHTSIHYYI